MVGLKLMKNVVSLLQHLFLEIVRASWITLEHGASVYYKFVLCSVFFFFFTLYYLICDPFMHGVGFYFVSYVIFEQE